MFTLSVRIVWYDSLKIGTSREPTYIGPATCPAPYRLADSKAVFPVIVCRLDTCVEYMYFTTPAY